MEATEEQPRGNPGARRMASGRKRRQRRQARIESVRAVARDVPAKQQEEQVGQQSPGYQSADQQSVDQQSATQPELMYGPGGLYSGRGDMALLRRANRERWPMTEQRRAMLLDQMFSIVEQSPDARHRIAAAKVIVAADAINVNQQKVDTPKESNVNVNVSGGVAVGVVTAQLREQMLHDDRYLEYLRQAEQPVPSSGGHDSADGNAGTVRADGEPGPVEAGETSGGA